MSKAKSARVIVKKAKQKGSITYGEIAESYPHVFEEDEKQLDRVIDTPQWEGVALVAESEGRAFAADEGDDTPAQRGSASDDPIHVYFSQMSDIPLLTKE